MFIYWEEMMAAQAGGREMGSVIAEISLHGLHFSKLHRETCAMLTQIMFDTKAVL